MAGIAVVVVVITLVIVVVVVVVVVFLKCNATCTAGKEVIIYVIIGCVTILFIMYN